VNTGRARLSVGMPVYNGERFLREAIDSILGQTYEDFELVVSDNASTDGTEEICRDYARRDPRVVYLRSEVNRGAAWNHNRLIEVARGSLFKWVGADDIYRPEFLSRCVAALDADPDAVLAYPRTIVIDEAGTPVSEYAPDWDLRSPDPFERLRTVIPRIGNFNADAVSGVVRTQALRSTRLLPRYYGGDKALLGELCLRGKFLEVPEYLLLRRMHRAASSQNHPYRTRADASSAAWTTEFFKGSALTTLLPSWSLLRDHLSSTWTSQLPLVQKLRLSTLIARTCRWNQRVLLEELRTLARALLRR
jgi:glycosyltransferase involved in cell wall biosynthesis